MIVPGFSASERDWCIPALLDLVREIARHDEVHVFALRYPYRRDRYRVYGAEVEAFGGALTRGPRRLHLLRRAYSALRSASELRPFDVLHGFWAGEAGFLAAFAGRRLGIPAIVSLMGGELAGLPDIRYGGQLRRRTRWLIRRSLASATRITTGSGYLSNIAAKRIPGDRLRRLPLGVDVRRFAPRDVPLGASPLSEGRIKLLHVASLLPVKDQSTILHSLARLVPHVRGIHLHLVGEGPLRPQLEHLASRLGLTDRVTFHGAVPHERLPDYYSAADLCVLASRFESQAMVVLEAAACGRTTIGTPVGILPELAPATRLTPIGDAVAMGEAIRAILDDRTALRDAGRAAREIATSTHAVERRAAELRVLYEEVLH